MWCWLHARAEGALLDLGEVPDLGTGADVGARPEVAERADRGAVLDVRALDDARPDRGSRRRSRESKIWEPARDPVPSPIVVAPRRTTLGSRITSWARSTAWSRYTVDGSAS